MGKGRGDEDDEVEVEGVDDAFEDAHQSDDEEYDANAIEEESDDEEDDANVMSPSKIKPVSYTHLTLPTICSV